MLGKVWNSLRRSQISRVFGLFLDTYISWRQDHIPTFNAHSTVPSSSPGTHRPSVSRKTCKP
jgi:hypothetical protein